MATNVPDLTRRPPRSVRVRLGGYAILPRMLDKGRATLAGTHGEYHFNCPTDQLFLDFVGVSAAAVKGQLAKGKWIMGDDFTLVDCAYGPVLNVVEKAGFDFAPFPKVKAYLDALRARPAWKETPKLPML